MIELKEQYQTRCKKRGIVGTITIQDLRHYIHCTLNIPYNDMTIIVL
jgi:hypothetical protein